MAGYQCIIIKEGYARKKDGCEGIQNACGTITLLKGLNNVIIDTGGPQDKELIIEKLKEVSLTPDDVQYVIGTHGHSDHIGNLNLFPKAMFCVCNDICKGDEYIDSPLYKGKPFVIDEFVSVVPSPGHTGSDVSVVVKGVSNFGTVVVAGDLFECEEDLKNSDLWKNNSENPELQTVNRSNILKIADYIIPGHGKMFKVSKS